MLKPSLRPLAALMALISTTQLACYNTYFIDKDELKKLESNVEQREIVPVYGDCPRQTAAPASAYRVLELEGKALAQADVPTATPPVANDASPSGASPIEPGREGCEVVPVSTANTLNLLTVSGERKRVTPFNFIMSETQVVSPEYNLLEQLNTIEGAEVKQFSTGKTVAMIAGTTLLTIGTFVAISLLAGDSGGFAGE